MSKNRTPNPLHPTFFDNGPNREQRRKYSEKSLKFKMVRRRVKEYTLRQHRATCVVSFMRQLK